LLGLSDLATMIAVGRATPNQRSSNSTPKAIGFAPFALVGLVAVSSGVALDGMVATNPQSTAMIPSSRNPFATAVRRF
jgi:hypothetical protein